MQKARPRDAFRSPRSFGELREMRRLAADFRQHPLALEDLAAFNEKGRLAGARLKANCDGKAEAAVIRFRGKDGREQEIEAKAGGGVKGIEGAGFRIDEDALFENLSGLEYLKDGELGGRLAAMISGNFVRQLESWERRLRLSVLAACAAVVMSSSFIFFSTGGSALVRQKGAEAFSSAGKRAAVMLENFMKDDGKKDEKAKAGKEPHILSLDMRGGRDGIVARFSTDVPTKGCVTCEGPFLFGKPPRVERRIGLACDEMRVEGRGRRRWTVWEPRTEHKISIRGTLPGKQYECIVEANDGGWRRVTAQTGIIKIPRD